MPAVNRRGGHFPVDIAVFRSFRTVKPVFCRPPACQSAVEGGIAVFACARADAEPVGRPPVEAEGGVPLPVPAVACLGAKDGRVGFFQGVVPPVVFGGEAFALVAAGQREIEFVVQFEFVAGGDAPAFVVGMGKGGIAQNFFPRLGFGRGVVKAERLAGIAATGVGVQVVAGGPQVGVQVDIGVGRIPFVVEIHSLGMDGAARPLCDCSEAYFCRKRE